MNKPTVSPRYVRVAQICGPGGIIAVSKSAWWAWVQAGKAPKGHRINGVTVWSLAEVLAFVEEGR